MTIQTNPKIIHNIQTQVAEWSVRNFGKQTSKAPAFKGTHLESLAPLLGIGEEIGELSKAFNDYLDSESENAEKEFAEILDAIGDIGIYLCDFCSREGIVLSLLCPVYISEFTSPLPECLGKINHVVLKRHQGIRGFDVDEKYRMELKAAVAALLERLYEEACDIHQLRELSEESASHFEVILTDTWNKVIQRDWVKNSANAHQS